MDILMARKMMEDLLTAWRKALQLLERLETETAAQNYTTTPDKVAPVLETLELLAATSLQAEVAAVLERLIGDGTINPKFSVRRAHAKVVTFLRPVLSLHSWTDERRLPWTHDTSSILGNVYGHRDGVDVLFHKDATVTLILRTEDGSERFEGIPADALTLTA